MRTIEKEGIDRLTEEGIDIRFSITDFAMVNESVRVK
jgi:hypothetical protein